MRGETVTVMRRVQTGVDAGNNPTYETKGEDVDNVLVGPPNNANATDSNRPEGIDVDATLYFPRTYTGDSLRGLSIIVRGHPYKVVGDPLYVDGGLKPTKWNMNVNIKRSEG